MLYQQKESGMNETAGKGVRLDSLGKNMGFKTRLTLRSGFVLDSTYSQGSVRVQFDDEQRERSVHAGCIVDKEDARG